MKPINLLPRSLEEKNRQPINPFWYTISGLAVLLLVAAGVTQWLMIQTTAPLLEFREEAIALDALIQEQQELTATLTEQENELEATIDEVRFQQQQQVQVNPDRMVLMDDLLERIIPPMPETLWLTSIQCDYREYELTLTGRTIRRSDLETYLSGGFSPARGFINPTRQYLRFNEDQDQYEFSFTVRFTRQESEPIAEAR